MARQYLKDFVRLSGTSDNGTFIRTFEIRRKLNEGASSICYEASYKGSSLGVLKEFYPWNAVVLERDEDGQLVRGEEFHNAQDWFEKEMQEYLEPCQILLDIKRNSPDQDLSTFIPDFEIYYGCDREGVRNGTVYMWTPRPKVETFDKICEEIHANPWKNPEHKLVQVLYAIDSLAKRVCALHCANLLHRDINPSNFGFEKLGDETLTQTLQMFDINSICSVFGKLDKGPVGKDGYMEPETGTAIPTNQTDLYAIGATLFYAIVICDETRKGGFLFQQDYYNRLGELVGRSELIRASEANAHPRLRDILTRILQKCLCERAWRYVDCEELIEDLDMAIYYALPSELAKKHVPGARWVLADLEKSLDKNQDKNSQLAIQYHLYETPLYQSLKKEDPSLNVLTIGFGSYGQKFMDACLSAGQLLGKPLLVTAVSDDCGRRDSDRGNFGWEDSGQRNSGRRDSVRRNSGRRDSERRSFGREDFDWRTPGWGDSGRRDFDRGNADRKDGSQGKYRTRGLTDGELYLRERPELADFFEMEQAGCGYDASASPAPESSHVQAIKTSSAQDMYGKIIFETRRLSPDDQNENAVIVQEIIRAHYADRRPHYVFVALGEDEQNLRAARACRRALDALGMTDCPVSYIREETVSFAGHERSGAQEAFGDSQSSVDPQITRTVQGCDFRKSALAEEGEKGLYPVDVNADWKQSRQFAEIERMALNIHLVWNKEQNVSFKDVKAEFQKPYNHDSCVTGVLSLKYKLHWLDIDLETLGCEEAAVRFVAKGCGKAGSGKGSGDLKNQLACMEHRRWVTEKLCAGWCRLRDLTECISGPTKDERHKKHVCIVRSRPDRKLAVEFASGGSYAKWDAATEEELAGLDELDRMSVELHRVYRTCAQQIKQRDLLGGHAITEIKSLAGEDSRVSAAFWEWYMCLENILSGEKTRGEVNQYKGLKKTFLEAAKRSEILSVTEKRTLNSQVQGFDALFTPVLKSAEYRDWKQDDVAQIEQIPFILTYAENTTMVIPYDTGENGEFYNVAAASAVDPKRILYLYSIRNAQELEKMYDSLPYVVNYMEKKNFRASVEFLLLCKKTAAAAVAHVLDENLAHTAVKPDHSDKDRAYAAATPVYQNGDRAHAAAAPVQDKAQVRAVRASCIQDGAQTEARTEAQIEARTEAQAQAAIEERLWSLGKGRIRRVKCFVAAQAEDACPALEKYLEKKAGSTYVFAEKNETRLSSFLKGKGFYDHFPNYQFDSSTMKFHSLSGCGMLAWLKKAPALSVADMAALKLSGGTAGRVSEFTADYKELWKKYCQNRNTWKAFCDSLGDYVKKNDTLAAFRKKDEKDDVPQTFFYLLPFACRPGCEKILQALKKHGIAEPDSRVSEYSAESCRVTIADRCGYRAEYDRLFSQVYALMFPDSLTDLLNTKTREVKILFDNLVVTYAPVPGSKGSSVKETQSRELLAWFQEKGYLINLRYAADGKVSFTFSTRQVKELLTKAGKMLEIYTYHKIRELGSFDDVVGSYELSWEETEIKNEFDCIVTKGFRSLFIECKARNELEQDFYFKISTLAKKFGINATAVLIADTQENSTDDSARINAMQRKRGEMLGVVTIWKSDEINNIGHTLLKVINGKYSAAGEDG
ncbi:MAG: DUF1887 family CARF protein [Lachnospiraceae bacterium]|nr:DUF1887 family CARF protein [Lachnospiraceae bacterium]